ncbi:MAG: anti-sigma factor family protein [Geminicoccaceae bacterium]
MHNDNRPEPTASPARPVSPAALNAFVDHELPPREKAEVIDFLAHHPGTYQEIARVMQDKRQIADAASLDDEPLEESFDTLADCLSDRLARYERRVQVRRWGMRSAAALSMLAVGWTSHSVYTQGYGSVGGEQPMVQSASFETTPRFLADAAGAHNVFAGDHIHPVEYTAAQEPAMVDWFHAMLDGNVVIPHIEQIGFDLVGGRLLGTADGPIAHVLYENQRGDRVSLFFAKQAIAGDDEIRLVKMGKTYASYWQGDEYSYAVVEDTPGADVSLVATEVAQMIKAGRAE